MGGDASVERAIAAVEAGQPVLLPTDTVYGLVTSAHREDFTARLYELKGRDETQPSALLAAGLEALFDYLPELRGRPEVIARTLLPGGFTLILPNPARRFRWLTGLRTDAIGVRVPELPELARRVVEPAGCVVATSANDPGGRDPVTLEDVPARIRDGLRGRGRRRPAAGHAVDGDRLHRAGARRDPRGRRALRRGARTGARSVDRLTI